MPVSPAQRSLDQRLGRNQRYALAVVLVLLTTLVRWAITPLLRGRWYMLYYPVIALAARFGAGPALLATVLSALSVLFLFIEPRFGFEIPHRDDLMSLGLHLISGAMIAAIGQSARRATARALASASEAQAQRQRLEAEIQERERAQAEVVRARERFREAQDRSLYGYTILEAVRDRTDAIVDFRWTYANPAAAAILQRPVEELIGQSLLTLLPGNRARSDLFERYARIVETGEPFDAEVQYDADGISGWFRNMTVRFDDGVAVSFFDITDRKHLEAALRLGQERFAVALKHSPILVYNCDAQLRYTWVHNPPAGFTVEAMLGRTDEELIRNGALRELTAFKHQVLASGRGARRSIEYRSDDQTPPQYYDVTAEPLHDPAGQVVGLTVAAMEVTDLVEAERQARERADEIEALMQVTPIAVLRAEDPACRVVRGNRAALELMRSPAGANLTRDGAEVAPHRILRAGRDLPTHELPLQVAARGQEVRDKELDIQFEDGTTRTIFGHARPLFDDQGRPRGAVSAYLDVTELKRVREQLRREHQRTLAILESITDAFYTLDHQWRLTYVNAQAETYLGHSQAELLGQCFWEVFPQLVGSAKENAFRQAVQTGQPTHLEFPSLIQSDHWIELHSYPSPEGLSIYCRDVSERKRTEQRVLQLNAALRHRVEELETLLDVVPIGLVIADDPACERVRFNAAFATLVGLPPGAHARLSTPTAEPPIWRARRDGLPLSASELPLQRAIARGGPVHQEFALELADGRILQLLVHAAPLLAEQGQARGAIAAIVDLTERRQLEEQLRTRAEELQELDRRKTEFLAMLGHELRNPLAAVQVAVETLRAEPDGRHAAGPGAPTDGDGDGDGDGAWARDAIARQVSHLARLVDDLLDAARVARGEIQLRPEPTDLATAVARAVETVQPLIESRGHTLQVRVEPALGPLVADPARLEQVLVNLLSNAAKYTDPGGTVTLTARADTPAHQVLIEVRDTGIGIAPEKLSRVFEMFTQLDPGLDRSRGGLGIGLALVQTVVRLHGGTISVQSAGVGQGSTFRVALPYTSPPAAAPTAPARPTPRAADGPNGSTAPPRPGLRVLVVDDNEDSARGLSRLLRRAGHTVELAHDGPAALEAAARFRPQAVLLDIGLPGLDGYEVARRLRVMAEVRHACLIAVSGYGQQSDRDRSRAAGFDAHLVKPVDLDALRAMLETLHCPSDTDPSPAPA